MHRAESKRGFCRILPSHTKQTPFKKTKEKAGLNFNIPGNALHSEKQVYKYPMMVPLPQLRGKPFLNSFLQSLLPAETEKCFVDSSCSAFRLSSFVLPNLTKASNDFFFFPKTCTQMNDCYSSKDAINGRRVQP